MPRSHSVATAPGEDQPTAAGLQEKAVPAGKRGARQTAREAGLLVAGAWSCCGASAPGDGSAGTSANRPRSSSGVSSAIPGRTLSRRSAILHPSRHRPPMLHQRQPNAIGRSEDAIRLFFPCGRRGVGRTRHLIEVKQMVEDTTEQQLANLATSGAILTFASHLTSRASANVKIKAPLESYIC